MDTAANSNPTTVVWYRLDLRTDDHQPLLHAAKRGPVVPVYIHDTDTDTDTEFNNGTGQASKWWLHHSLQALSETLNDLGSPLVFRVGDPKIVLKELCDEVGADQVAMHESTDPRVQSQDDSLDDQLHRSGIELVRFQPDLLWPVGSVLTAAAKPYQVFTPFWNRAYQTPIDEPANPPERISPPRTTPRHTDLSKLGLLDTIDWASGFRDRWLPGEPNAMVSFKQFIDTKIDHYHLTRDQLNEPGWSALSAPIHFGELSVRRMWSTLSTVSGSNTNPGIAAYLRQLGWHDFAIHLMNHFPHTVHQSFRPQFDAFPWVPNDEYFSKWKRGMTGYPIVDAAMRQLWAQGWMPNRARMIAASFLCKDLLISWKDGAAWFWDTLVDADLANNNFGWQWTAGCGADAAPYFRVFNPISQGKKFDPQGAYVRTWIPELAQLPNPLIHEPWEASPIELLSAGITLGEHYPHPVVNHAQARIKALEAYAAIK